MSVRSFASLGFVVLAVAATVPAAAFSDGFVAIDGEAGFQFVGTPGSKSRDEVRAELQAAPWAGWRLTEASPSPAPVSQRAAFTSTREQVRQAAALSLQAPSDGWRDLGGEAGWVFQRP
jgi:hypothetical protein